jgi:hypothetical protein
MRWTPVMYSPATLNGTAPQAMVPQIGSTAVPFVRQEPPVQSGSPASSASAPTRRPRQATASYIPAASTNLTDRQNYFFQRGGPELVQILMVMDDFRSGSVSSKPTVARFIEDVKFAFLNGNRGQRQEELPAVLSALQGAISFNSRMRATRDQAVAWASAQDWRLVPHVEEALSDCRRSVLKELYRGSPIREDLISIKRVIEKATDSAIVSGILPTTTTATPATTPPTMMTTTRNPRAAIDSYFDKYKTAAVVPYPDWAQGKFTFPDLDTDPPSRSSRDGSERRKLDALPPPTIRRANRFYPTQLHRLQPEPCRAAFANHELPIRHSPSHHRPVTI